MQEDQGTITVRFIATDEEVSVDMNTLREWIVSRKVLAGDLVRGSQLTGGQWTPLKDLPMFYEARGEEPPTARTWPEPFDPVETFPDRYGRLRTISTLCKVLALIVLIGTIFLTLAYNELLSSVRYGAMGLLGGLGVIGVLVQGAIVALLLWALGELIPLWVDIEDNTRRTTQNTKPLSQARRIR